MRAPLTLGLVAAAAIGVAAGALVARADEVSEFAHAWIDDPLDGTSYAEGTPVEVVAHATSTKGLSAVEFIADDAVVERAGGGVGLVLARFTWTPPGPGAHRLVVRAVETETRYRDSEEVTVLVGGSPEDAARLLTGTVPTTTAFTPPTSVTGPTTPTLPAATSTSAAPATTTTRPTRVTTTTTATTTATTTRPCPPGSPEPESPTGGRFVGDRTPTLSWFLPSGCPVDSYTIEVASDPRFTVVDVTGSSVRRAWTVTTALQNCTTYSWRVRAVVGGSPGPWSDPATFRVDLGGCTRG